MTPRSSIAQKGNRTSVSNVNTRRANTTNDLMTFTSQTRVAQGTARRESLKSIKELSKEEMKRSLVGASSDFTFCLSNADTPLRTQKKSNKRSFFTNTKHMSEEGQ